MKPRKPLTSEAEQTAWLKRAAVYYLSQRSSSVENLRQVLLRKAPSRIPDADAPAIARLVERAVAHCLEYGYVDDLAYAEGKVASGLRRGVSRRRLSQVLASKGVEDRVISEVSEELDDARAAVIYAKRRRIGPWRVKPVENAFMKDVGAFARAGFSSDLAIRLCRMSLEEAERLLYGEAD